MSGLGPIGEKMLDPGADTVPSRMTADELREWGRLELERRRKDWAIVFQRTRARAKAAGLTDQEAARAVLEACGKFDEGLKA